MDSQALAPTRRDNGIPVVDKGEVEDLSVLVFRLKEPALFIRRVEPPESEIEAVPGGSESATRWRERDALNPLSPTLFG